MPVNQEAFSYCYDVAFNTLLDSLSPVSNVMFVAVVNGINELCEIEACLILCHY